ncbi:MAG: hypothetical protein IKY75_04780 [Bacteroidaceae bacterium]|nr:hypothetical protein [Bacteroidaceae bacterium]
MDYLDIILYIVFAIIGIFSSINSTKAKKRAENKRKTVPVPAQAVVEEDDEAEYDQPVPEVVSLDDIFRALREGRPLETVRKETLVEEHTPIQQPVVPIEEGIRVTRDEDFAQNEISDRGIYTDDESVEAFSVENVDWRQAVITSEILNRKY